MAPPAEPERTCVGCRVRGPKDGLLRVVRRPDGTVSLDQTGRAQGRGAYVHRDPRCVARAARRGALQRALRMPLGGSQAASLMRELDGLMGDRA